MRAAVLASAAAAAAGLPSYPPAQPFTNYTQSEVDAALRRGADWRSAAGPVQGQGALGSASPIAVAEAVAASWNLRHKQMLELSEQQIIDCAGDQGRLGPVYELSYVAACGGLESATQYPAGAQKCGFEPSKIAAKVANYTVIPAGAEGQLAAYLAASGPVVVGVDATSWQTYTSGIKRVCPFNAVNHAALLVGLGTDPEKGHYWVVKNSWGASWGEGGYIRVAYGSGACGIAAAAAAPILP
eukprot:TRINITY_DN7827_c1_g1_i3.p1 TRINITY_DN7827_c1_g1~~TRINITY_DN7827_c1_g1_i3.p1  ORF type:complete len:266 (+),score=103.37 TRINITY_DN7827_c1_g1_i3:74-799(+)